MMGWVTERLGSLFRAERVSHAGEGASADTAYEAAMEAVERAEEEKVFMAAVGACGRDMGEHVWNRHHRVDHYYDDTSEASVSVFRADAAGGVRWSVVETYSRWGGRHDIHDETVTGADSEEAAVRFAEEGFSSLVDRIGRDGKEADDRLQAWEDQQIAEFERRAVAV